MQQLLAHLAQGVTEAVDVGLVEHGVYLIEDTERGGGNFEQGENGQIGYVVILGSRASETVSATRVKSTGGYQPIVYKTTNSGASWSLLPAEDFANYAKFRGVNDRMYPIETSIFTKQIKDLVSDEEYRQLQQDLLVQPDRGDLIKNGGGIRKVRCAQGNKGKSGGIRVIYYWVTEDDQIFFLVAYPKSVKDNLTDKETAILHQLVKEQFHG